MDKDQKLSLFFGDSKELTTKEPKAVKKDWSSDWLKMREQNLLAGGTSLTAPYQQSYIVYRAIRSIAENVPTANFRLIENAGTDSQRILPKDSPLSMLFTNPNPVTSRFEFWESIATYLNLTGEAFIYLNKSVGQLLSRPTAVPAELWVLDPRLVKHAFEGNELAGWTYNNNIPIDVEDMIQFRLFNPAPGQIRGLSPLTAAKNELESDWSASKWNKVFFDNSARTDGVIEIDKDKEIDIADLRKVKNMWAESHRGTDNSHKIGFLLGGMTYKPIGMSQKDMDFIQQRQFSRDSILSVFGVHPFVAGFYDSGTVTRATAKEAKRLFWTGTIQPQLKRIEEKLQSRFFTKYAPTVTGVFDLSSVEELRDDYAEQLESAAKLFALGYTRNEVNRRLELGMPTKDVDGDIRYLPINLIPVGDSSDAVVPEDEDYDGEKMVKEVVITKQNRRYQRGFDELQKQYETLLSKILKRYFFDQRKEVLGILNSNKALSIEQRVQILAELDEFFQKDQAILVDKVSPVYRNLNEAAERVALDNIGIERAPLINEALIQERVNMIKGMSNNMYDKVKKDLSDGVKAGRSLTEISDNIRDTYNVTSGRAKVIARTESASLINSTTHDTYAKEGVREMEWITTMDGNERATHAEADGQIRGIGESFNVGGAQLRFPGDPGGPPEEVINCRCSLAPVIR